MLKIVILSDIQIYLNSCYFYLLNLTTLYNTEIYLICLSSPMPYARTYAPFNKKPHQSYFPTLSSICRISTCIYRCSVDACE